MQVDGSSGIKLNLHGFDHEVKCEDFDNKLLIDANILGIDYFLKNDLNLTIDYEKLEVVITQSQ